MARGSHPFLLIWAAHLSFNIIIIENLNINVAFFQDKLPSRVGDILKVIILLMQVVFWGFSFGMDSYMPKWE